MEFFKKNFSISQLIWILTMIFSIGGFYKLTSYRLNDVENKVMVHEQKFDRVNETLLRIEKTLSNIEGKLSK